MPASLSSSTAYTAPHWPLHAHPEDIAKYKGRFDAGWDELREERLSRMIKSGLIHPDWKLTDRDPTQPPWTEAEERAWLARCMEVYAAQIDRMDQGIGRVLKALEDTGQMDDTLVIFLSDNGACAEDIPRGCFAPGPRRGPDDRPGADPRRLSRALRQHSRDHARRGGHLSELRGRLGQPSPTRRSGSTSTKSTKAASPRPHSPLAGPDHGRRRAATCAGPTAGHHGNHSRCDRRRLSPDP